MNVRVDRRNLVISGAAALAVSGCSRLGSRPHAGQATIGVLTPLTGDGAVYGEATRKGVDLAVAEINAGGGVNGAPLKVAYEDDRIDPAVGVSAFQRLVAAQKPCAVLGPFGSSVVLAVAPAANAAKVPILSASATADSIADAGDYVFRIVPPNARQGADDAQFSVQRLRAKTAAIIYQNNEYGATLRQAFTRRFTSLGGRIVGEDGFDLGATDYRAALGKVRALKPDIVFFPLHSQEATLLLRQAREQTVTSRWISGDGAMTQELITGAGVAAEGVYFSTLALGFGVADTAIRTFRKAFAAKYGPGDPDVYSAYYYEATKILARVVGEVGPDPEAVKKGLYAMSGAKAYVGITGRTSFDAKGEVDKPFYVYRVRSGKFELATG